MISVQMYRNNWFIIFGIFILVIHLSVITSSSLESEGSLEVENLPISEKRSSGEPRTLDPLGLLRSASRIVRQGVHLFRESLHEGVKVTQLMKQEEKNRHRNRNDKMFHRMSETEDDTATQQDKQITRDGVLGGILSFMGVDSRGIGLIALNVLIFLAEMITSSLLGKDVNSIDSARAIKTNFMEWLIHGRNEQVEKFIEDARAGNLPDRLIETLQDRTGNSTSCVQLLLCKMSPFIWGVQKSVGEELEHFRAQGQRSINSIWTDLWEKMPGKSGYVEYGDKCEKTFPTCQVLQFRSKVKS